MTDDGAIGGGGGLDALAEAVEGDPAVTDSSEAPSAKPKQPSPYLGWQKWTLEKFVEMFPLVDVEDKSFTVPMMKREQTLRGLGTCKSTARETAARWTRTVRAGKDLGPYNEGGCAKTGCSGGRGQAQLRGRRVRQGWPNRP